MKFVGREVIAGLQKRAQNRVALRGLLEADSLQVLMQDVLRLPHHLGGDGRLIIDAFLQHGWNLSRGLWDPADVPMPGSRNRCRSGSGYHRAILKMKFKIAWPPGFLGSQRGYSFAAENLLIYRPYDLRALCQHVFPGLVFWRDRCGCWSRPTAL